MSAKTFFSAERQGLTPETQPATRPRTRSNNRAIRQVAACILALGLGWSTSAAAQGGSVGEVNFGVSCDEAFQADFDHALGMMHHMMYVQARAEFEEIAASDPDCAMAYWGMATTLFQPLWGTRPSSEELQRGWNKIERAKKLAKTERERHLIEATAGFFREPETAEFGARLERWIEGMDQAYQAHPDDADTAALYALSRLTLGQRVEDRDPLHDEAEAILRAIHEEIPTHPGAIHYSIHATDADGRAENALDMVEAYGDIAPEVAHALHMPTHIYVRLGRWPEVIDWNLRSADAALKHPVNDSISHHYIHAMDYVLYAQLQRGEDDKAAATLDEALNKGTHQASFVSAFHAAVMPARYAVERREWDEAVALEPRTPDYLPWDQARWAEGLSWYARGLGGVHSGDLELAREAEESLAALREQAEAAGDQHFATYLEVDWRILAGWIAYADGDADDAIEMMRSAAELEGRVEKHPVTPGALVPPQEALGELLVALERPAEALKAYRASQQTWPERYRTLLGAGNAAAATGDEQAAREYYGRLLEIAGDSPRPGVVEAGQLVDQ